MTYNTHYIEKRAENLNNKNRTERFSIVQNSHEEIGIDIKINVAKHCFWYLIKKG
ncbi:hypothetical protein PGB90_010398 [Kerria lacca]